MRRRVASAAVLAGLALGGVLPGCSSERSTAGGTTDDASSSSVEHRAAAGVCRILVAYDRTVANEVNEASEQIALETDPDDARALLLEATDDVRRATDFLPERYQALNLPDDGDAGRLVDDARANVARVDEQLDLIEAELTDGLDGEDARSILSAAFIDYEKVQSLAQPDQGDYTDPELVAELDTLEDCEHTISR